MKIRLAQALACAAAVSMLAFPVRAADDDDKEKRPPTAAQAAQQSKMKTCNAEAGKKGLKGDERRAFMSACLKG